MKKVFRNQDNTEYWEQRWLNSGCDKGQFKNLQIYPIKYAELAIKDANSILEAGCGTGRVYFHYDKQGKDIQGIELSHSAISAIKESSPDAKVIQGSITDLPYHNCQFDTVFAFGLYHNIESLEDLKNAFSETKRVMKSQGRLVASVRFDSLENNLIESIIRRRSKASSFNNFHRWHFSKSDLEKYLAPEIEIEELFYVRNVSFLFKFDFFREKTMKSNNFNESTARSEGFKLNKIGELLDKSLHWLFPKMFSNLLVIIAKKS